MKVHRWTVDVLLVVALTALADLAVLVLDVQLTPLRIAVLLPLVLFLPGYAFIGVLYPHASANGSRPGLSEPDRSGARGIDAIERIGLSIAASLAIVPLLAFALNFTPAGIRAVPILLAVSWFTFVFAFLTFARRFSVEYDRRFRVPPASRIGDVTARYLTVGRRSLSSRRPLEALTPTHRLLNVLLVVSVLVLVGSVAIAATLPSPGDDSFTEYYLVAENDEGEYVSTGLPHEFAVGQGTPVSVAIANHEGERTTYTTVVKLQEVRVENGETRVVDDRELTRVRTEVAAGETEVTEVAVTPTRGGEDLRLIFLLYEDGAPADPTAENAYVATRLYVTVRGGAG